MSVLDAPIGEGQRVFVLTEVQTVSELDEAKLDLVRNGVRESELRDPGTLESDRGLRAEPRQAGRRNELEELDCRFVDLNSIDVSNNSKLKKLFLWGTEIDLLDVSNNLELENLIFLTSLL